MTDLYNTISAEIVLPAGDFQETLNFFIDRLGFRIDSIAPADDPAMAQISGYGLHLCIDSHHKGDAGTLCLRTPDEGQADLMAPNGTRIQFRAAVPALQSPALQPSLCIAHLDDDAWKVGRAGMLYRDLITDRQGGRFIASHIRIPEGGPVPDNVHYHNIHFQLIYCYRGWVRLVYEDQGEPFVMHAGDCVLQPPLIRHRVLEASDGLEVIEVGSPAEHMTYLDHEMTLPTTDHRPDRLFGEQRYTLYRAEDAAWEPTAGSSASTLPSNVFWRDAQSSDLGLADATNKIVSARVLRCTTEHRSQVPDEELVTHDAQLAFWFVLKGSLRLSTSEAVELSTGDSLVVPAGMGYSFTNLSQDLELLEIVVPAI
ncbi:MAG: cupin domain-containing protein [Gammaproteobacteria bacterium]